MEGKSKNLEGQLDIPPQEQANMAASPVTSEEMSAELQQMQEAVTTEVEPEVETPEPIAPETPETIEPAVEPAAEPELAPIIPEMDPEQRRENEARMIEALRERMKRDAPPTPEEQSDGEKPPQDPEDPEGDDEGPNGGGGRMFGRIKHKYKTCPKCGGSGRKFFILPCFTCGGTGNLLDSTESTWEHSTR